MHISFCPALRSVSQCLVNTTDGSTIVNVLSVPWIHNLGTVQAESKLWLIRKCFIIACIVARLVFITGGNNYLVRGSKINM